METDVISRDPQFRSQFDGGVKPDPEFEAALGGYAAPTIKMQPAPQPLGNDARWVSTQIVRLR